MTAKTARDSEYYDMVRAEARKLWSAINNLVELQRQWNALNYSNTLEAPTEGAHEGILPSDIGAVVFDTANAMVDVLNSGHATNIAKVK